jgi:hypothetical protein
MTMTTSLTSKINLYDNRDIMGIIVRYTGDRVVLWTLRDYIDTANYRDILLHKRRILIYGKIQSGKTAAILTAVQNPLYDHLHKVIIIQNSLLVLRQYQQRICELELPFQVVDSETRHIHERIVLLMNNKWRYLKYQKLSHNIDNYVLFMDESDAYEKGCHLLAQNAIHEYYITATPRHKTYQVPGFFHKIHHVEETAIYKGLDKITIEYNDKSVVSLTKQFVNETPQGMLLINAYKYISEMETIAYILSHQFDGIPVVLLTAERKVFCKGRMQKLKQMAISKIIDQLKPYSHIVFIANRMSLRGLSYCSSDYSRHLTHQYSDFKDGITITNSLQRMRLLGKYVDNPQLKLILPSTNRPKVQDMFDALNMKFDVCREFTL